MQQLMLDGQSVPLPKFTIGTEKIIRLDASDPRYDDYSSMECVIVAVFLVQHTMQLLEHAPQPYEIASCTERVEYRYQVHIPENEVWDEEDIVVNEDELV